MRLSGFDMTRATWGIALAALAASLYIGTMPRATGAGGWAVLNSPDAAAVQVAARRLAVSGSPIWEPAGEWPAAGSAPRSFTWVEGGWAPGSYVGLPAAYAGLDRMLGFRALIWVSPLLGSVGVLLMYMLARRWRGPAVGLAAGALLMVTPAYWHASIQPFTPTIPLVVLLLAAVLGLTGRRPVSFALGGVAMGVALAIRPHEAIWVLPAALFLLYRRAGWKQVGSAIVGLVIPLAIVAWLQLQTYGSILGTGYSLVSAGDGGPFSLSVRAVATNVWRYIAQLHGYLLGLAAAGAALASHRSPGSRRYIGAALVVAAGLLLIYGSYLVHDSPGIAEPTIGNSQVRYMLPLLALLVPLAASFVAKISSGASVAAVAIAAVLGYGSVVAAPGDGTLAVQRTLDANAGIQRVVLFVTDDQTLVVAGRLDKLFVGLRPTAFAAGAGLAGSLREGRRAVMVGGTGVPEGVRVGRRAELPSGLTVQELLAE